VSHKTGSTKSRSAVVAPAFILCQSAAEYRLPGRFFQASLTGPAVSQGAGVGAAVPSSHGDVALWAVDFTGVRVHHGEGRGKRKSEPLKTEQAASG